MTFTPTDSTDYSSSTDTVSVTVSQAIPNVTWPTASAITYGQTLADSSSAVAPVMVHSPGLLQLRPPVLVALRSP